MDLTVGVAVFLGFFIGWCYKDQITAALMWVLRKLTGIGESE